MKRTNPSGLFLRRALLVLAIVSFATSAGQAQDTRMVKEPAFPSACAVLRARLAAIKSKTLASSDETKPDTTRIQAALDHCQRGRAVELEAGGEANAFLSGPLQLPAGVTLRVEEGAFLFGSRNPRDYDISPGSCGVVNRAGRGCKPLISADHAAHAAVMGPGVIDGRGWANLLGEKVSWWDLAEEARAGNRRQQCPLLIVALHSDDFTLYRITLRNSPMYHVLYRDGSGFTAWGVVIDTPKTARNTDGIDPLSATNVTITHCSIHAGDDDVAIKAGNDGPASHISIVHNHFYTGHGVSIGSETNGGVSAVVVRDLSMDGADNGIRIKSNISRGGLVHNVMYENVCIRDTRNPILMDSNYSFYGEARNEFPTFRGITLINVRILGPGRITLDGYDTSHRLGISFNNVTLGSPQAVIVSAIHAKISLGPGPVNFRPSGEDVTITGHPGTGSAYDCTGKFPPFPLNP